MILRTDDALLRTTLRGLWPSLPALLIGSVAVCVAAVAVVLVAPGWNAVSMPLAASLVAPAFAGVVGAVGIIADTGEAGVRDWARSLRRSALPAAVSALVPTFAGELFLVALLVWDGGRRPLALPSLAVTGAVAVIALVLWGVVVVAATRTSRTHQMSLRDACGPSAWLIAARLVAVHPSRPLAAYSLAGLGVWAATTWSASVLLLVPAPFAAVLVAAVRTTCVEIEVSPSPTRSADHG